MGSGEEPSSSGKQVLERGLQGRRENPTGTPLPKDFGELPTQAQQFVKGWSDRMLGELPPPNTFCAPSPMSPTSHFMNWTLCLQKPRDPTLGTL